MQRNLWIGISAMAALCCATGVNAKDTTGTTAIAKLTTEVTAVKATVSGITGVPSCTETKGDCTLFITASKVLGDMSFLTNDDNPYELVSNTPGVAGADAVCSTEASMHGLPGTYKAWLSEHIGDCISGSQVCLVASEKDAISRVKYTDAKRYVSKDGRYLVARAGGSAIKGSLLSGRLMAQISHTDPMNIWTGTGADGLSSGSSDCSNWSSLASDVYGDYGTSSMVDGQWTAVTNEPCNTPQALLCVETGEASVH